MIDDRRRRQDDDALEPRLERAVNMLRVEEPVPSAWRDRVLAGVSVPPRRRARVLPWASAGIAAVLCAVVVGVTRIGAARDGATVRFAVSAPSAKVVSLVGDFDGWNPVALPMRHDPSANQWVVDVRLPPGRHVFAFSIDGGLRADPAAPRAVEDDFGVPTSVVVVSDGRRE